MARLISESQAKAEPSAQPVASCAPLLGDMEAAKASEEPNCIAGRSGFRAFGSWSGFVGLRVPIGSTTAAPKTSLRSDQR